MNNIRKQQKSFVQILILLFCVTVFAIGGLLILEFHSFNGVYAQENNVQSMLSDVSDSVYLELYNEDGTMQMIPEPDNVQN